MTTPRPIPRLTFRVPALAVLLALLLAAPAAAQDPVDPGGIAAGTPTFSATPALVGQPLEFAGTLGSGAAGASVAVQLRARRGAWHTVTSAVADAGGGFRATWASSVAGRFAARAIVTGRAVAASAAPPVTAIATVFRRATATWYDLHGRTGACGVRITRATLGVAHRSLPCGSRVDVTYAGRTISVPVIDRGPYARGVSYDLTLAAADVLGMTAAGRARVGVLPAGERTPAAPMLASLFGGLPAAG